jgi:hypothetical protein
MRIIERTIACVVVYPPSSLAVYTQGRECRIARRSGDLNYLDVDHVVAHVHSASAGSPDAHVWSTERPSCHRMAWRGLLFAGPKDAYTYIYIYMRIIEWTIIAMGVCLLPALKD